MGFSLISSGKELRKVLSNLDKRQVSWNKHKATGREKSGDSECAAKPRASRSLPEMCPGLTAMEEGTSPTGRAAG